LNGRVFSFELNGETVLGFDTGLNVQAFAQTKMARLITRAGSIVYPDGRTEIWQPGGVVEFGFQAAETMVIWGPLFPGENLAESINESGREDEALDALRFWLKAAMIIEENSGAREAPFPGPAGAFVVSERNSGAYPAGSVFFPPTWLIKRTLDAEGTGAVAEAERWTHPDLEGPDGISFSAASMLYRIFCGVPPFPGDNGDKLRQDIREAVFIPPDLASPGIVPKMSELISRSMCRAKQGMEGKSRPSPDFLSRFIGSPGSRQFSSWLSSLSQEEISKIRAEQKHYIKRNSIKIKTRRFVIRNTAVIAGAAIAFIILALMVRGFIQHRAEMPSTKGMDPLEVAGAYYSAFGNLDHTMMQACVTGKAGKQDIEMVINFYVISRVREAYERNQGSLMTAQEWIDAGRPATEKIVFGITNLSLKILSQSRENASIEADYILWMPGTYFSGEEPGRDEETSVPVTAGGLATSDRLGLAFNKNAWHIAEINRTSNQIK